MAGDRDDLTEVGTWCSERECAAVLENCAPEHRLILGVTGDGDGVKPEFLLSGMRGLIYVDPHIDEPEHMLKILSRFSECGS